MPWSLKAWRRKRVLARAALDPAQWERILATPYLSGLSEQERARLRQCVILFLDDKTFHGARNLSLSEHMKLAIAAQACLLILNLGIDYYAGWKEIIIYPDEFIPRHEYVDDAGVVHVSRHPMAGEAWPNGPVILSWADIRRSYATDGINVVIHEFAHKLDMLNGAPNGFPPLHKGMQRTQWARVFADAYEDFSRRVDAGEETAIDWYAAENPAEFFAVLSEVFFEAPQVLAQRYVLVYEQMKAFYRQDPLARLTAAGVAI